MALDDKVAHLLDEASRCRDLAQTTADPDLRLQLVNIAVTYEKLARQVAAMVDRPPQGPEPPRR